MLSSNTDNLAASTGRDANARSAGLGHSSRAAMTEEDPISSAKTHPGGVGVVGRTKRDDEDDTRNDDSDVDDARILGAARLAFYTPVIDQPSLADRKATFLLTMTGLVATTLFLFVQQVADVIAGPNRAAGLTLAVLASALVGLLLGAARYAYAAYVTPMPAHPAATFFRHVAARELDQYVAEMRGAGLRQAVEAILHYNHAAATQAANKYRGVNRAQAYMRLAIPVWMAAMLLVAICR